jgi:acetolactate synthase-1/2/3 large subunit
MSVGRQLKYAAVLGDWLVELGYTHCFMVAGGGCMHLIDGFRTRFQCIPVVHEVTAGIAVEHFNECRQGGRAFALVTTGPGLTNIVTAIAGSYVERRELLVIAGQVKSTDLLVPPLRQRGVQEVDGVALTKSITIHSRRLQEPIGRTVFRELVTASWGPHPGPVMIEVCLDVQGAPVERAALESSHPADQRAAPDCITPSPVQVTALAEELFRARRPLLLLGGLVSRAAAWELLPQWEALGLPVMTTTSAIDRVPSSSPVAAGRPGTWGGQRAANLLLAQADFVLAVGAQLDLQQTGFNCGAYAPQAQLHQVYPCAHELAKGHPPLASGVLAKPDAFLRQLTPQLRWNDAGAWADYVRKARMRLPVLEPGNDVQPGYVSSFRFLRELSLAARPDDVLANCSSGGTFTGALQTFEIAPRQIALTSPAWASMGYGLATAIGAAFARPGQRVIAVEGDGGFAQNLQELALVKVNHLPLKLFVLDNRGYGSIRATQRKFFGGAYVGCDTLTGLGFPDWPTLFAAYGLPARYLTPEEATAPTLARLMASPEAEAWIVPVDPEQPNWPAVSSRILPDGRIESNPLYRMLPPLEPETLREVGRYLPKES